MQGIPMTMEARRFNLFFGVALLNDAIEARIARVKILKQQIHKLKLEALLSVKQNIITVSFNPDVDYAKISYVINRKN